MRVAYQRALKPSHYRERRDVSDVLGKVVPRGGLVFDVGANRGDMAANFLRLRARVIAIEPNPELAALVRRRYGGRRLAVEACAVGEHAGTAVLHVGHYDEHSTLSPEWRDLEPHRFGETVPVPVRTLDDLIEQHGTPDFVKIDVEGFELSVLMGLHHRVPALSFEFRDALLETTRACLEAVSALGPYEFGFAPLDEWTDADGILKAVAPLDDGTSGDIYARLKAA